MSFVVGLYQRHHRRRRRERGPMTDPQLAQYVMADRGLNTADKRLVKTLGKRVEACLRYHKKKGLVWSMK